MILEWSHGITYDKSHEPMVKLYETVLYILYLPTHIEGCFLYTDGTRSIHKQNYEEELPWDF